MGVALTLVSAAATIWLAATGRLSLYIHPRYTVFTLTMALLAVLIMVAVIIWPPHDEGRDHDQHDDHHAKADRGRDAGHGESHAPGRRRSTWSLARLSILLVTGLALLVVPPATLSATARQDRDLVSRV